MSQIHYLTVQDVLWINLQVTKKVQKFQYAKLEEATFYQYAYGVAQGVFAQADRFAVGFRAMRPFEAGNEATAFVGTVAFLILNGLEPQFADAEAKQWFAALETTGTESSFAPSADHHGSPDPRTAIKKVLSAYPGVIATLVEVAAAERS